MWTSNNRGGIVPLSSPTLPRPLHASQQVFLHFDEWPFLVVLYVYPIVAAGRENVSPAGAGKICMVITSHHREGSSFLHK